MSATLPRMCFDSALLPEESRFALWCASIAPLAEAELTAATAGSKFTVRSEVIQLGQLQLRHTIQYGLGSYRYKGAHQILGSPDVFFLQTYLKGGFSGHNGEQAMSVVRGDVVLVDAIHALETRLDGDEEILSLVIPRQVLLAAIGGRHMPAPRVFPRCRAETSLLRHLLVLTWAETADMTPDDALVAESLLLGALAGTLKAQATAQSATDTGLPGLHAHIERHLHDPAFGVEALGRHFHMSRAAIYRLFKPVGGVAAFIRQRRLERCHADLLAARPGETVALVARRWGFVSEAHFSRIYRLCYGASPGETLSCGERSCR